MPNKKGASGSLAPRSLSFALASIRGSQCPDFQKEIDSLQKLRHPNIVRLVAFKMPSGVGDRPALVMERCTADITELMGPRVKREDDLAYLMKQILAGVKYMHEQDEPIIHR